MSKYSRQINGFGMRFIAIIACMLVLTSCETQHFVNEENLIEKQGMMDKGKFVEQTKQRKDHDSQFGPEIKKTEDKKLREMVNQFIAKEEAHDYVNLSNNSKWNIFPVDVNVENMEIRSFMGMISKISGINILVSDEVRGTVTAKLEQVPWPNVMDSILNMKALAKHVDHKANIIRIHDQNTVVQLEEFERKRREALQKNMLLERASEPLYTKIFKLFYSRPDKIKEMLEGVIGKTEGTASSTFRNTDPQITIDERKNSIIVKARKDDIRLIEKLVSKIDTRTQQVFIEAFIVEVTDGFEKALGTRLGLDIDDTVQGPGSKDFVSRVSGLAGTPSTTVGLGDNGAGLTDLPVNSPFGGIGILTGIGSSADLKFELTAMEKEGLTKVISNPRIFTLDNQEATIFQGDEIPFETVSDEGTKIEFKEAGLKLLVTPTIVGDGNLMMEIAVNKDTADTSRENPPITKSEIQTNLISKDGSVVVIGGIYTEAKTDSFDKVPLFGDLPVAGKLFRRDTNKDDRKELMIFIAPRVI